MQIAVRKIYVHQNPANADLQIFKNFQESWI